MGEAESMCAAARSIGSASEGLLVACLGGRIAGPLTQCLAEYLAGRGQQGHLFATLPFDFEGVVRRKQAVQYAECLSKRVQTLNQLDLAVLLQSSPPDALFSSVLDDVAHRLLEVHLRLSSRKIPTVG